MVFYKETILIIPIVHSVWNNNNNS